MYNDEREAWARSGSGLFITLGTSRSTLIIR